MNVAQPDLAACRKVAVNAAEAAGRLICSGFANAITCESKGTAGDIVTSLDLAAERLIVGACTTPFLRTASSARSRARR